MTMRVVYPVCAGIDVHKAKIQVCLVWRDAQGHRRQEVRTFKTMTNALLVAHDWLSATQCPIIALESTGTYWKPIFNLFAGEFEVMLVNPAHLKHVKGRKTDVQDAAWLAELLEHGLLQASFIPPVEIRDLRDLTRYRRRLIQERSAEMNRVQKVLEDANIKLGVVASDVFGVSGRAMLDALLEGQKTPAEMAELAQKRLRQKREELREALTGRLRAHHRLLLGGMLAHIDFLTTAIGKCDTAVEELLRPFTAMLDRVDTVPGVNKRAAEDILAEIGLDMSVFPSHKHLCSWAAVCPGNKESGGKRLSGKTRKGNPWLKAILVQCAQAAGRTKGTDLGAQFRRMMKKKGVQRAAVAVAHSILTALYFILRDGVDYRDFGVAHFDQVNKPQLMKYHRKRLEDLGFAVELSEAPVAA
jgi:transposase